MKFLPKKASKSGVLVQKSGMYLVYSNFVVVVVVCGNVILLLRQQIHKKGMKIKNIYRSTSLYIRIDHTSKS